VSDRECSRPPATQTAAITLLRPALPAHALDAACGWAGEWTAPWSPEGTPALRLLVDQCCLELFANDGAVALTALVPLAQNAECRWLRATAGSARLLPSTSA